MIQSGCTMSNTRNKLWYRRPAPQWDHGLPVGNGRLGAVALGATAKEHIQLNEDSLWSGGPGSSNNARALQSLPVVRKLLFEGKPAQAMEVADSELMCDPKRIRPYQTLGDLILEFLDHGHVTDYRFELDLDTAVVSTSYRVGSRFFFRELFASYPDQVIVLRLSSDHSSSLTFSVGISRETGGSVIRSGGNSLAMNVCLDEGTGVSCWTELRVLAEGGIVPIDDGCEHVSRADRVTLILSAVSNYRCRDPRRLCETMLGSACEKPYLDLLADHIADHRALFCRTSLDLGQVTGQGAMPTDDRLESVRQGVIGPDFIALYFQYARYLLIASSRPDPSGRHGTIDGRPASLPANLQGIWNNSLLPPWNSGFHLNINLQMNYWIAEPANLSECHLPLFDLLESLIPHGQETARVHYECHGFVAHHITDIWGFTAPGDGAQWDFRIR